MRMTRLFSFARLFSGFSTMGVPFVARLIAAKAGAAPRRVAAKTQMFLGGLVLLFVANWLWTPSSGYVMAVGGKDGLPPSAVTRTVLGTELVGVATAAGSDTIALNGYLVRLQGIDGFENTQSCIHAGERHYRCGDVGKAILADHLATETNTHCLVDGTDHWGRVVATCTQGGTDLAELLVREGYALALPGAKGARYGLQMEAASESRAGAWAGTFMDPWNARLADAPN